jgi:hypothetical protein
MPIRPLIHLTEFFFLLRASSALPPLISLNRRDAPHVQRDAFWPPRSESYSSTLSSQFGDVLKYDLSKTDKYLGNQYFLHRPSGSMPGVLCITHANEDLMIFCVQNPCHFLPEFGDGSGLAE